MFARSAGVLCPNVVDTKNVREKYSFPVAVDGEPVIEYVFALEKETKCERVTLGGFDAQKYVLPNEASLTKNQGRTFFPQQITRMMTEKQAESLKAQAQKVFTRIDNQDVCVADILVLEPCQRFVASSVPLQTQVMEEKVEMVDPLDIAKRDALEVPKKGKK